MTIKATKALYAGSFDPITKGHLNIIWKAIRTFDEVHVGVGVNASKTGLFTPQERKTLIEDAIRPPWADWATEPFPSGISVGTYEGSLTRYARDIGATHLVRGLRQVSDFNDEFTLAGVLGQTSPDLNIVHLICDSKFLHVSSSTARELARIGDPYMSWLVTGGVEEALREKYGPVR